MRTADRERRKRNLYVATDRRSQSVHLAVKDNEAQQNAIALLRGFAEAFPFLSNNGSCFTPAFKACEEFGAEYQHTKPHSPQPDGIVELLGGRAGSEVLGITI